MKFFITGITILITVPPDKGDIGTVLEGDEAGRHLQLLCRPRPPSCKGLLSKKKENDCEQPDNSLCKIARADSLRDFNSLPTTARVNRIEGLPCNQTLAHLAVEMMEMVLRMVVLTSSASSM